ncbi:POT family MFS transporter [Hymenobacter sp. BT491]|uniref:POT family MFS transporter n=1 Tax=Hymenobacter sp. BT491 TaxID=2766779 RepID=UPI001653667E|nr:POT family MFS transporter [Hymenobacter sp. BT491]MBC6989034.1 POT family MFS transporter [Hymenobacter sp. BT491]
MPTRTLPAQPGTFPKAVPFIVGNEVAERFSYYGMRAILPTFLVAQFYNPAHSPGLDALAEARANDLVHSFVALGYAMPVLGALLADWVLGKYRVILYVSLLYCVGHVLLAAYATDLQGFRVGLLVVAVSMGGIKSSVTANLGDQFNRSNAHLLPKAYGWFQLAIDVGAAVSTAFVPILYARFGAAVAFGVPGILMAVAALTFWLGRHRYVRVPPTGFVRGIQLTFGHAEGRAALVRVGLIFAFIPVVWALYDQSVSEWVLQAAHLNRQLWPGFTPLPEQLQILGIVFGIGLNPLLTYRVYPGLARLGIRMTPLRRIGAGMVIVAVALAVVAGIQHSLDTGGSPSVWWQVLAYFIVAGGTLMVAVTGLEYAYTQASESMKSLMTALWLLTIAAGNFFLALMNNSIVSGGFFARFQGANYYWFFVGLMAVNVTLFAVVAYFIKEKTYLAAEEDAIA